MNETIQSTQDPNGPDTEAATAVEPAEPDSETDEAAETAEEQATSAIAPCPIEMHDLVGILEALIFVSGDPVPARRLADVLDIEVEHVRQGVDTLSVRLNEANLGIQVMEVAGGYQLRTRPVFSNHVNRYLERKRKITLSAPALETLAIIAYKQPITRAEIENIRGVSVDGVLKSLLDKRLIKMAGVKEVPGRPNLYATAKHFLEYFGMNSLKDLPPIENIAETFSSRIASESEAPLVEEPVEAVDEAEAPVTEEKPVEAVDEPEALDNEDEKPKDE